MLNTNHDQEFCPSCFLGFLPEAERQSCAVTLKSDNEPGRCWSFCPMLCSKCGMAMDSKFGSSLKFNIFQHFHKFPWISINFHEFPWFQSFGIHGIEEFAWQSQLSDPSPQQMCNRSVIMVTSLPFQSNFRRPWQPWQTFWLCCEMGSQNDHFNTDKSVG